MAASPPSSLKKKNKLEYSGLHQNTSQIYLVLPLYEVLGNQQFLGLGSNRTTLDWCRCYVTPLGGMRGSWIGFGFGHRFFNAMPICRVSQAFRSSTYFLVGLHRPVRYDL